MKKPGPKSLQSIISDALPKQGEGAQVPPVATAETSEATLPPHTLRDAKAAVAARLARQNEDAGQSADKGAALSGEEVLFVEPEPDDVKAAIARAAAMERAERQAALGEQTEDLFDEVPDPGAMNAAMKGVIAEQLKSGATWNPLHANNRWFHFLHDFIISGRIKHISGSGLKILLVMKAMANKDTGIVIVNQTEVSGMIGLSVRQIAREIAKLVDDGDIRQIDSKEPVKGGGLRYQVIERITLKDALPVPPGEETVVTAAFPYSGTKFQATTEVIKSFAKEGRLPVTTELELVPRQSPHMPSGPVNGNNGDVRQNITQNITVVNVQGNASGFNFNNAGSISSDKGEINTPDGKGNPLKSALKTVKTRRGDGDVYVPEDE